jgi:hypothetical protein
MFDQLSAETEPILIKGVPTPPTPTTKQNVDPAVHIRVLAGKNYKFSDVALAAIVTEYSRNFFQICTKKAPNFQVQTLVTRSAG